VAYTLIKNCLFIPKFNFLLRTTPFWKFSNYVNSIDSSLKSSLEKILNLRLTAGSIIKIKSPLTEKVHFKKKNVVHKQHLM
jgi:hypothetical protein